MNEESETDEKPSMTRLTTGALARNLALTRLGLGAGTAIAAHSLANVFRGDVGRTRANRSFYQRQAQVLADELGRLKGSVMKAGQMLSLYGQYFLPEEAVAVLARLQDSTQPVAWEVIAPVLEEDLGRRRLAELEIDPRPLAAASLGQVHRARRKADGAELCVKIQYPGVAAAIDSDVRTLSRILLMTRLAPKGLDLKPVFAEVREMLHREVDYRLEREFTEFYARRLADDPRFVVPRVVADYCSERVLTTTFEGGVGVRDATVQALPQARRDRLATAFIELFLREFFAWRTVQSDPHFGNYRFRLGESAQRDRIVLLDFGATRRFTAPFVAAYAEIVRGAVAREPLRVIAGARGIGLMNERFPQAVLEAFVRLCELLVEPFNDHPRDGTPPALLNARGEYRWSVSDLPMRAANLAARNALSVHFRIPPREIIFLHRRLAGAFIMCATLRAELNARPLLLEALAAVPPTTTSTEGITA